MQRPAHWTEWRFWAPRRSQPSPTIPRTRQRANDNSNMNNNMNSNRPQTNTARQPSDKFDIHDVRDMQDIDHLTVRQLKTILTRNCVDYKNVIEKEELKRRVTQLWIEHNESKSRRGRGTSTGQPQDDDSDGIAENQLCKICMEREIDCVLLECGHYLTCVTCGRKLSDCPVCRQTVIRCVRTFKA